MTGPFQLFFGMNSPDGSINLHTSHTAQHWGLGFFSNFFSPAVRFSGAGTKLHLTFTRLAERIYIGSESK